MKFKNLILGVFAFTLMFGSASFAANSNVSDCLIGSGEEQACSAEDQEVIDDFFANGCSSCNATIGAISFSFSGCDGTFSLASSGGVGLAGPCFVRFYRWIIFGPGGSFHWEDTAGPTLNYDFSGWGNGKLRVYVRAIVAPTSNPDIICFSNTSYNNDASINCP